MLSIRRMGPVVKLGSGNLGGKARVLPFLQRLLDASGIQEEFAPHRISVPETWVLTTHIFREFVAKNRLGVCAELDNDDDVRRRFLSGRFSNSVKDSLKLFLETHKLPLAVRSSALSEDTYHHATAGLFETHFTPNLGRERFRQLLEAVKLVMASAYFNDVARYMRTHSIPREDEEMAVALETVVGQVRGDYYYPLLAGVGQSINYFPVGQMIPDDGVATMVMGLGSRAVAGQDGMRFCPRYPTVRPHFQLASEIMEVSQQVIDAVDMRTAAAGARLTGDITDTIARVPIEETEDHGSLVEVASVYDRENDIFYDNLFRDGQRVVTFNRLLRESSFPLPSMLTRLFQIVSDGFGYPVEIEFALNLLKSKNGKPRCHLVLLQARPLPALRSETEVAIPDLPEEQVLARTDLVLGHGKADGLTDIVFVDPDDFSLDVSDRVAEEVAAINEAMRDVDRRYILLGPGRWGSCNKAVGVPVNFAQIDQAMLVAEVSTRRLNFEPSQGTHFFHNMISRDLFFLTIDTRRGHRLDLEWLRAQPNSADTKLVKHIKLSPGAHIRADARRKLGIVYRG
jgi:hypothetical protein